MSIAAGLPAPAASQQVITLDQAVQRALANNPSMAAARAGVTESGARADAARGVFFPRLSFTESWQRGDQPVFVFGSLLSARRFAAPNFAIDSLNHPDPTGFFHAALGVEQLLFDGGRTRAEARSAAIRRDIADRGARQAAAEIALATTQAYGRLLAAQARQRSAGAAAEAAQEDYARAQHRRDVGSLTEADVLSLAVHAATVRQQVIEATSEEAIARAELNRVMGMPVSTEYGIAEPPVVPIASARDIASLVAEASRERDEIARADAAVRLATDSVSAARAAWMPHVAAQAGYELSGTRFTDRAPAWIVGGELRWTLSAGGVEAGEVRAARAALARAEAERNAARAGVEVDVVAAVRHLESAEARAVVAASAVEQARESQRIIRDRFEAGLAGVTDVLRAATALLEADAQRVGATVDAVVGDALLRRAVGRTP